jgi:hypothetical protein
MWMVYNTLSFRRVKMLSAPLVGSIEASSIKLPPSQPSPWKGEGAVTSWHFSFVSVYNEVVYA